MPKLIAIDKNSTIKIKNDIVDFLNPDFVNVPIFPNRKLLHRNKHVKKGEELFTSQFSPISGKIVAVEEAYTVKKGLTKCMVIQNDFCESLLKEQKIFRKLNEISKEMFFSIIDKTNLKDKFTKNFSTILVSGIDDRPYFFNENIIQKKYTKEILEVLDMLCTIFSCESAIIAIKNTDFETILKYESFLGMYPNIHLHLVEDLYLIGEEKFLKETIDCESSLYLKASNLYSLYLVLKNRTPIFDQILTIAGDVLETISVFRVKIGTKLEDLLRFYYNEDFSFCDFFVNGKMQKTPFDNIKKYVITEDMLGLVIMNPHKTKTKECMRCGKCVQVCPMGLNPMEAYKTKEKLKCLNCGLCTYICPAYIPLYDYLEEEENE